MQLVETVERRVDSPAGRVIIVVLSAIAACGLVAWDQFWLWPMIAHPSPSVTYSQLPDDNLAGVQRLVAVWIVLVISAATYEVLRLRAHQQWKLDYPYSWWRTAKSALLVYGWTVISSILPNTAMGLALFKVVDLSVVQRDTSLLLFNVVSGLTALTLACGMVLTDAVASSRAARA